MAAHSRPISLALGALAWLSLLACARESDVQRNSIAVTPVASRAPETASTPANSEAITELLRQSVHRGLDCSDCHAPRRSNSALSSSGSSPDSKQSEARCEHCHEKAARDYSQSVHASIESGGRSRAAVCAQCHGNHDIQPVDSPASNVSKRNLVALCSGCHESPASTPRMSAVGALAGVHYLESIHGKALVSKGLMVAPSCLDCHGSAHRLSSVQAEGSPTSKTRVAETCGRCHEGIKQKYDASTHASALAKGNARAPTCPTCHTAHDITAAQGNFAQSSDKTCGQCHATRRNQYLDTYHGRAHALGDSTVAACFDCHQAHDVIDTDDPRSSLSEQNRVATCRKCHAEANRNFAAFMPHADHQDREKYPALYYTYVAMTGLLLGTFAFFGIHTLLWFGRSVVAYAKDPKRFRQLKREAKLERGERVYRRFRPVDRFCHLLVVVSFLLLVATGMPLKFHDAPWAIQIFDLVGGPKAAARLHRFGALITFSYFAIHIASLIGPIRRRRAQYQTNGKFDWRKFLGLLFGPDSPAPNLQDAKDSRCPHQVVLR
ncbi:MAG: hypothetical protein QM784_31610 [Polyangiaceae bacterium]